MLKLGEGLILKCFPFLPFSVLVCFLSSYCLLFLLYFFNNWCLKISLQSWQLFLIYIKLFYIKFVITAWELKSYYIHFLKSLITVSMSLVFPRFDNLIGRWESYLLWTLLEMQLYGQNLEVTSSVITIFPNKG